MRALFAGVQLKTTLGTFSGRVGLLLQYVPTLRAAGNYPPAGHLNGAWAESVLAGRPFAWLLFGSFWLAVVLVTALAIFHLLRRPLPEDCLPSLPLCASHLQFI